MAKKGKERDGTLIPKEGRNKRWDLVDNEVVVLERDILSLWKNKIRNIRDIGIKLDRLKQQLSHGEYKRTIERKFPFSYSSARNYRNVGVSFDSAEDAALFDSRTLYEIAKPGVSPELRRVIIKDAKQGGKWNVDKVKGALGQVKKAKELNPEENVSHDTGETHVSPFVDAVKSVKDMVSTAVLFTKGLPWPEQPEPEDHQLMDSILTELKVLAQAFRPVPKKFNG